MSQADKPQDNTDDYFFGYERVSKHQKTEQVRQVFASVASKYDIMNDLMSLGIHRLWKKIAIEQCGLRPGHKVLDVAAGSGDLSRAFSKRVGADGLVLCTDINANMLAVGRERLLDAGCLENTRFCQANAECLPFKSNYFDCVSIGFGLRNVSDIPRALRTMHRVLKPGGRLVILEFSKPVNALLAKAYDAYSFSLLPALGKFIAKDETSYRYLAESIRKHPGQEKLADLLREAGFEDCSYHNLSAGIVATHKGFKY